MKILVTGVKGQLGHEVYSNLVQTEHEVVGADIDEMDITDRADVKEFFRKFKPDAVIHCAAWTAVDAAEDLENRAKVFAVNYDGTKNIAEQCKELDCKMLYISTDYVFNGKGNTPWKADCQEFEPLNIYGESKLKGERAVCGLLKKFFIVRIAWLFGLNGNNFVNTMLKVGKTHDFVRVVNDQIGTPTYCVDLVKLLVEMIQTDKYGYYHATNEGGFISWFDFTKEIFRQAGIKTKVIPVSTREYGLSKASRPFNSRLDKSKLSENGFTRLPDWKDALRRYLAEFGNGTD